MQRYFVDRDRFSENEVTITGDDAKHIERVMRMEIGDEIICSDNHARVALCQIEAITSGEVKAKVVQEMDNLQELPLSVTIAQGLPKGDKLDLIVQKGTELGADSFIPLSLARSIVKWDKKKEDKKLERLQKIAKEAAEQSHRALIPVVHSSQSLSELIRLSEQYNHKIIAYEETAKTGPHGALKDILNSVKPQESLLAVIGPEGGFTEEEVSKLEEHGFIRTSFGPRILRTETAALYLLAAVSYHIEILG